MTVMLPKIPNPEATGSEKVIFNLIENARNSENFVCLHSVGIARHERKSYAECDFVLIGPLGVFCFEVKGGEVSRKEGLWHIGWPGKSYTSTEGPFKQAQSLKWPLKNEVELKLSKEFTRDVLFGWGVVFPDIEFCESDPEWDLDVVFDARDKDNDFLNYVKRLAGVFEQLENRSGKRITKHLPVGRINKIVDCFRHDFDLIPKLRNLISDTRRELISLGSDQYKILDFALAPDNPRALCLGPAGTGKTIVALEAARRFARQGHRVLFLCFNVILAEFLKGELSPDDTNINVFSLHRYMRRCIDQAGMKQELKEVQDSEGETDNFYRHRYPELFEMAILNLVEEEKFQKFDILILDEAQDILHSPTIDAIGFVLKDGFRDGSWMIFYDPGLQSKIYGRMNPKVLEYLHNFRPITLPLNINYRNPPAVIKEMSMLIGIETVECKRALDSTVDYITYGQEKEQGKKLKALLVVLLKEGVKPGNVTILSGCRIEKSCVFNYPPDVGKKIQFLDSSFRGDADKESFSAGTISAFKGMENDIIILTDLPVPDSDAEWDRSITYVGMTRAKTKVYALISDAFLSYRLAMS